LNIGGKVFTVIDKLLIRGKILNIKFKEKDRSFVCLVPDDSIQTAIKDVLLLDEYGMAKDFKQEKFRDSIIVDAGAHVGLFSLKISPYARKVICIEPLEKNYRLLKENLYRNKIGNAEPLQKALWVKNTSIRFIQGKTSSSGRIKMEAEKGIEIEAITLKEIVERYGRVDLLKLDVEGSEYEILLKTPNSVFDSILRIVGEIHLTTTPEDEIKERLEKLGYATVITDPPVFFPHYSLRSLLRNFPKVKGLWLLKIIVFLQYAIFGIVKSLISPDVRNTKLLFAKRLQKL